MTVRTVLIRGLVNATGNPPAEVATIVEALCTARPQVAEALAQPAPPGMLEGFLSDPARLRAWLAGGHNDVVCECSKHVKLHHTPDRPIVYLDASAGNA